MKNELLGAGIEDVKEQQNDAANTQRSALLPKETRNLFQVTAEFITEIFDDIILSDDEEKNNIIRDISIVMIFIVGQFLLAFLANKHKSC